KTGIIFRRLRKNNLLDVFIGGRKNDINTRNITFSFLNLWCKANHVRSVFEVIGYAKFFLVILSSAHTGGYYAANLFKLRTTTNIDGPFIPLIVYLYFIILKHHIVNKRG